jgi:hypothetical protein
MIYLNEIIRQKRENATKENHSILPSNWSSTYCNLFMQSQGSIKKIIEGDKLGNFYTTDIIGFGTGLFPAVVYKNDTTFMSSSITYGSCNSCHGKTTSIIEVD